MPKLCNICLKTNQLILLRAYSGNSVVNMKTKVSKHTLHKTDHICLKTNFQASKKYSIFPKNLKRGIPKLLLFNPGAAIEKQAHVFIPSFLSMKLLHKIVEIYASIKGLHELQTKDHNVCASFSSTSKKI